MNQNLKLLFFVIILASVTSILLIGMDALTADRIEQNEEAKLKSFVLNANEISFNYGNIHDVFDEKINIVTIEMMEGNSLVNYVFYQNEATGAISYEFIGDGVWGKISGIITLESDFETIVNISIISQVETPGLGGIVAEENYLKQFVGKSFIENEIYIIKKDSVENADNEVDAISGATRTSSSFNVILNTSYQAYKDAWMSSLEE